VANQLDLMQRTASKPLYEEIPLSEFHPSAAGSLRVRVNPSRRMIREIQAARDATDNEAYIKLTAQLIPIDTDADTPMTAEQFKAFLDGQDEDDARFSIWLMERIWEKVTGYFLSGTKSPAPSTAGVTPSTPTATP
jgi:hypothetical protein